MYEATAHPDLFRGAVSACSPYLQLPISDPGVLADHGIYLVSRQKDWNLTGNQQMYRQFQGLGIPSKLVITPGEHAPGNASELLDGCRWLWANTSANR